MLITDIADFYHSIYTHSIAWALHTKAVAKANRHGALLGNQLDTLIRNSQDRQTIGIPIGPDTSFVIAECILTAVEPRLIALLGNLMGLRFIDDFELCFSEYSDAERALSLLQQALLEFELRLNHRKTHLEFPPIPFEPEWVSTLKTFHFRHSAVGQRGDIVRFFDLVAEFVRTFPNDHVTKYALARFASFLPHPTNRELLQALLCQAIVGQPGAVREAVTALTYLEANGVALDLPLLTMAMTTILRTSAPLGHHYELSWILWAVITFGLGMPRESSDAISAIDNSVVAILAIDAGRRGLLPNLDTTRWEARMVEAELLDEEWLLAYEANVQGWLPSVGGGDHVATDRDFGWLKAQAVHFYVPAVGPIPPPVIVYP